MYHDFIWEFVINGLIGSIPAFQEEVFLMHPGRAKKMRRKPMARRSWVCLKNRLPKNWWSINMSPVKVYLYCHWRQSFNHVEVDSWIGKGFPVAAPGGISLPCGLQPCGFCHLSDADGLKLLLWIWDRSRLSDPKADQNWFTDWNFLKSRIDQMDPNGPNAPLC